MAKLGDFKAPTGASGNILNPMDWLSFILGAMVLIITFAMGQNFAKKLGATIPGIDGQPEQPWSSNTQYVIAQPENQKSKVIL